MCATYIIHVYKRARSAFQVASPWNGFPAPAHTTSSCGTSSISIGTVQLLVLPVVPREYQHYLYWKYDHHSPPPQGVGGCIDLRVWSHTCILLAL